MDQGIEFAGVVKLAEPERGGLSDAELAAKTVGTRKELKVDWSVDTCRRYLQVAARMDATCQSILNRWELAFQRNTMVDGITVLRAAATTAQTPQGMATLLETLYWEQTCKVRRSIAPKGRGHASDAVQVFRGILLRQVFHKYLKQICPKLSDAISVYGTWEWYKVTYGMTETKETRSKHHRIAI